MPYFNNMGTSDYTPIKQQLYKQIVIKQLGVLKSISKKYEKCNWKNNKVLIIDTTAGCGYNKINDGTIERYIPGSPIIVYDEIIKEKWRSINFHFICIDIDEKNCEDLRYQLSTYDRHENVYFEIIRADNKLALDEICKRNLKQDKKWQYGWIYNDPNGNIPIFDYISTIKKLNQYRPFDLIFNIPMSTINRTCRIEHCKNNRRLKDFLYDLNKKFWWINDTPHGRYRFCMAFGTNWSRWKFNHINYDKKYRFISTETMAGQKLLDDYSMTNQEKKINSQKGWGSLWENNWSVQ